MEETKSLGSSTNVAPTLPQFVRPRHVPDVPQDVDFIMEHFNDPNYDLRNPRRASDLPSQFTHDQKRRPVKTPSVDHSGKGSDFDTESHADTDRYSHGEGLGSRSSAIDFDEYVYFSYSQGPLYLMI
jgi:hypothetical protein